MRFANVPCCPLAKHLTSPTLVLVRGQCVAQLHLPAVRFGLAICNDGLVQAFTFVHVLLQSEYFSLCEVTREGARGTWEVSARTADRLRSRSEMPPQEDGAVLRTAL
jgi:hypothetical protein